MTRHRLGTAEILLLHGRRLIESDAAWIADEPYLLAQPAIATTQLP